MPTTIEVGPLTRIEGHLDIEVTVDSVGGQQQVVSAKSSGTMFRGFEIILAGRDPRDAPHYTQRICGVCPVSHGMAASLNLDAAFGVTPPDNGRILRNLVLGANFIQSHVLHFYHLSALDYIDTTGLLDMPPWTPRYTTPDLVGGGAAAQLVDHYVQALEIRRKSHQMGAIFGGKLPCSPSFVPGGCSEKVTSEKIGDFRSLLAGITHFLRTIYVPDVELLADAFPDYLTIGRGCGNLLAYGVFNLDAGGNTKLFRRGCYTGGRYRQLDHERITEQVKHSRFSAASGNLNPAQGVTEPEIDKPDAYSWVKAPRYMSRVHEAGPLARMWINGDYRRGISALDRIMARALESVKIADAMADWLDALSPGDPTIVPSEVPSTKESMGLTEAPRGALGHWMDTRNPKIHRYQVITPTAWNASPKDDRDEPGPIEQALVGTPVADTEQPVEVLRVVHSFDPCLACAVHVVRPGRKAAKFLLRG